MGSPAVWPHTATEAVWRGDDLVLGLQGRPVGYVRDSGSDEMAARMSTRRWLWCVRQRDQIGHAYGSEHTRREAVREVEARVAELYGQPGGDRG